MVVIGISGGGSWASPEDIVGGILWSHLNIILANKISETYSNIYKHTHTQTQPEQEE